MTQRFRSADQPPASPSPWVRNWGLFVLTLVYALNIADRFVLSTLVEPIKAEFRLSDSAVGFLTGASLAIFYTLAGIPLGALADRANRRRMIIAAVAAWSALTAVCGLAQNFWHLLSARIGVGIGEAGGTPPSHSILADYFRPNERVVAMSIYALGIAAGSALGGIGGGFLTEAYGWRGALIGFAVLGCPVLLMLSTITEPARGIHDAGKAAPSPSTVLETIRYIRGQRALVHVLAGATIATFSGMGLVWWTPAFLMRTHHLTVGAAGLEVGIISGLGGAAALLATTIATLKLATMPMKRQCQFLALVTLVITVPGVACYLVADRQTSLILLWLFVPFTNVYVGPALALLQNLTPSGMRGVTVAVLLFAANMANLLVAPQLIGFASDIVARHLPDPGQSLRYALAVSGLTGLWAAYHFWAAIAALPRLPAKAEAAR